MDRRGDQKGFTLLEIAVSVVLTAISIVLALSVIPLGVISLKKAEDVETATLYGCELIEDASAKLQQHPTDFTTLNRDFPITLNSTKFAAHRDVHGLDDATPPKLYNVNVTLSWDRQPEPVQLTTRVYLPPQAK